MKVFQTRFWGIQKSMNSLEIKFSASIFYNPFFIFQMMEYKTISSYRNSTLIMLNKFDNLLVANILRTQNRNTGPIIITVQELANCTQLKNIFSYFIVLIIFMVKEKDTKNIFNN